MKNPLSQDEMRAFERQLVVLWREVYHQILASGMVSDDDVSPSSHLVAKVAIAGVAEKMRPLSARGRALMKNVKTL